MYTKQPSYHCVANQGDVNPLDHGGRFVMIDRRGIYDPQLWIWEETTNQMYEFDMPRCFPVSTGARYALHMDQEVPLGDNRYHPYKEAWYGEVVRMKAVAESSGMRYSPFRHALMDADPCNRAEAWASMFLHFGGMNFDERPCYYDNQEAKALIEKLLAQVEESCKWKDGLG